MRTVRDNIRKKDIIINILKKTGLPKNYITKIIDDFNVILIDSIIKNKIVKIKNFGTFFLKKKNKRIGRNPISKTDHEISARNVVTFKLSENLKKKLN